MKNQLTRPKFSLGQINATPAALAAIQDSGQSQESFLDRHVGGDRGTVCRDALGTRLLSACKTLKGRWVWIITEADRSVTTIMLPTEYRVPPSPRRRAEAIECVL